MPLCNIEHAVEKLGTETLKFPCIVVVKLCVKYSQGIVDSCYELNQKLWCDRESCADAFIASHLLSLVATYTHPGAEKQLNTMEQLATWEAKQWLHRGHLITGTLWLLTSPRWANMKLNVSPT